VEERESEEKIQDLQREFDEEEVSDDPEDTPKNPLDFRTLMDIGLQAPKKD